MAMRRKIRTPPRGPTRMAGVTQRGHRGEEGAQWRDFLGTMRGGQKAAGEDTGERAYIALDFSE